MSNRNIILALELTTPIDDDRPVFVAGNFCSWYPNVAQFQMKKVDAGKYHFEFPHDFKFDEPIEYKYTRGGWDQVELNGFGEAPNNRVLKLKQSLQKDFVPHWRTNGKPYNQLFVPLLQTISDEFELPQLSKKRRIQILLPYNYHQSNKHYPVLYLQDGQNLFGAGSGYGSWEIDKKMAILAQQGKGNLIVVAIDHAFEDRLYEYIPYTHPKFGKGAGKRYANFIVRTLKPFIDKQYRTLPQPEFTGIGGSSMGGLVSLYAGLMYPEVLGKLMVFSPSLWVSNKIYFDIMEFFNPISTKMYLYAGGKEGRYMIPSIDKLKEILERQHWNKSRFQLKKSTDSKGDHTEARWAKEFPKAIDWLFDLEK